MTQSSTDSARHRPKLEPHEQHFRVANPDAASLHLFLRYLPPRTSSASAGIVFYAHGATFPSSLSVAHRFDGHSWRDDLASAGFHVWGLDFQGYGLSDRYPEMSQPANQHPPLCRAPEASRQIEGAVRFILDYHRRQSLNIIAHSWASIPTGLFAGRCPKLVRRIVFFGPIIRREGKGSSPALPAWSLISLQAQWDRFLEDVPPDEPPVLSRAHFSEWGPLYLATDPENETRTPASVKIPNGPLADLMAAWHGDRAYDPALIRSPVAIIRGEWDSLCSDADARRLFDVLTNSPIKRDIKISRGTHLMHLEESRYALYREAEAFLLGCDTPAATLSDQLISDQPISDQL